MALLETLLIDGHDYTFQQLRHFTEKQAGVGQEGVVAPGDYDVTQRGAGANMSVDVAAGDAWIKADTGTRNGLYLQSNDGVVNVPIAAAHATLGRVDQVVLRINDPNVPTGAGDIGTLEVLQGTPVSDAGLNSRSGAAALGNDRLRLADIYVGPAAANITNAVIRDRRPWSRGAHRGLGFTTTQVVASGAPAAIANLTARMETSGGLVAMRFSANMQHSAAGEYALVAPFVDGVAWGGLTNWIRHRFSSAGHPHHVTAEAVIAPSAGSHQFSWGVGASTNNLTLNPIAATEIAVAYYDELVAVESWND